MSRRCARSARKHRGRARDVQPRRQRFTGIFQLSHETNMPDSRRFIVIARAEKRPMHGSRLGRLEHLSLNETIPLHPLNTQLVRAATQDIIRPDLEYREARGPLDRAEQMPVCIECRPTRDGSAHTSSPCSTPAARA